MNSWFVYIAQCSDESLYTGISNNVKERINSHNLGRGASYTKSRRPVKLIYTEEIGTHSEALKREAQIKKLNRKEKLNLING